MTTPLVRIAPIIAGWSGAGGSDIFSCSEVSDAAWGERARGENSGLTAFAYLWRRFGPSNRGSDPYKDLVTYTLTTPDPQVRLVLHLSGSALYLAPAYVAHPDVRAPIQAEREAHQVVWEAGFFRVKGYPDIDDAGFKALPEDVKAALKQAHEEATYMTTDEGVALHAQIVSVVGAFSRVADGAVRARVQGACIATCRDLLRPVWIRDVAINIFGRCETIGSSAGRPVKPYRLAGCGIDTVAHERKWKDKP